MKRYVLTIFAITAPSLVNSLSTIVFKDTSKATVDALKSAVTTPTSKIASTTAIEIELPDFDKLFQDIEHASPLAKQVLEERAEKGFSRFDASLADHLEWNNVENNARKTVHQIDIVENYNECTNAPLLRFRASLNGPCLAGPFVTFITDLEHRKRWDTQIKDVNEIVTITDFDTVNIAMGYHRYGDCTHLGIGYSQTNAGFGISSQEQLTLCGVQEFHDGSVVIWGKELDNNNDNLLPETSVAKEQRTVRQRAKSHIFAITMTPTSDNTFDVEYILQHEVGDKKLPTSLTTPIIIDSVKNMFRVIARYYADRTDGSELDQYLKQRAIEHDLAFSTRRSKMMAP